MDQFIDWVYSQLVGFFGNFFAEMGNMGVELFEMSWVQSIVLFFSYLAWTLYVVGLVVAVFEVGIEYQTGRASIKDAAISAVKGFMAVGCFTLVPVELYKLSVTLQANLTSGITGYGESFDALSTDIINSLQGVDIKDWAVEAARSTPGRSGIQRFAREPPWREYCRQKDTMTSAYNRFVQRSPGKTAMPLNAGCG